MNKLIRILFFAALAFAAMASSCEPPPPPPFPGFTIHTVTVSVSCPTCPDEDLGGISVSGFFDHTNPGSTPIGSIPSFQGITDGSGRAPCSGCIANVTWEWTMQNGPCPGFTIPRFMPNAQEVDLPCPIFDLSFTADPSSIDASQPPVAIGFTGSGIDATYGMPHVRFYADGGSLVAEAVATAVSSDGTWLSATPDLTTLTNDSYGVQISNVQSDGTLQPFGATKIDVYGNVPPPPPPPDNCSGSDGLLILPNC